MARRNNVRKMSTLSMLVAAGILMQLIEAFFPVVMIVPGYKIGLANITGLYALYAYGPKEMFAVTSLRIVLASLCMGTLFSVSFILSVCGGLLGMLAMYIAWKTKLFSIYGVSVAGAAFHAFGQVMAITAIYQQYFMQLYLPVLVALSILSGLCIALLAAQLLKRLCPKGYVMAVAQKPKN